MSPKQIVQLLRSQVIPWAAPERNPKIVQARAAMRVADLPDGVTMTRRKIVGKRVLIRNQRIYGNQRYYVAEWPEANLQELAVPKIACIVSGVADYLLGNACVHCGSGTFILITPLIPHHCNGPELQGERLLNGSCAVLEAIVHKHGVHIYYTSSLKGQQINEFDGTNTLWVDGHVKWMKRDVLEADDAGTSEANARTLSKYWWGR